MKVKNETLEIFGIILAIFGVLFSLGAILYLVNEFIDSPYFN